MTAQPSGHVMWTPDPIKLVLTASFPVRPAIADITP
jgi:hypothetical protein